MNGIIGLDRIANWGSPEVAGVPGPAGMLQASTLPKSFVGVPPTIISAGDTESIQVDVQREIRPDRFVVGGYRETQTLELYALRRIRDIRVGTVSLNASENPVPAEIFSHGTVGISIRATMTAVPSIGIQVIATNTDSEGTWTLRGGFFGPSASPDRTGSPAGIGAIVGAAEDPGEVADQGARDAASLPQSFVGIPYTTLVLATRTFIQVPVQRDIRPDRLVLPDTVCQLCQIDDVRVGTVSLNASMQPVPAECFHVLAFGTRLRATVTATPSVGIGITVTQHTTAGGGIVFCGAIFGPSRYSAS